MIMFNSAAPKTGALPLYCASCNSVWHVSLVFLWPLLPASCHARSRQCIYSPTSSTMLPITPEILGVQCEGLTLAFTEAVIILSVSGVREDETKTRTRS